MGAPTGNNSWLILAPQGAEYQAIQRGLHRNPNQPQQLLPLPMGKAAVIRRLQELLLYSNGSGLPANLIVMGLCGSLNPDYQVGDVVVYEACIGLQGETIETCPCDRALTAWLATQLSRQVRRVKALTSDRFIDSAQEKRRLGQTYRTDVVDMEGIAILQSLQSTGIAIAMVRVVSDDCYHDMPNLSDTLNQDGSLRVGRMAIAFLRQPRAALRLIQGSLQGLRTLQNLAQTLKLQ